MQLMGASVPETTATCQAASTLVGACLTPPGEGGLHVFRIVGGGAADVVRIHFRPSGSSAARSGELRHGHLIDGNDVIDEVLLFEDAGDGSVEISTHGGAGVRAAVEALLVRAGVRLLDSQHVAGPRAAFGPAIAREAIDALTRSWTREALLFALAALEGRLARECAALRDSIRAHAHRSTPRDSGAALDSLLGGRLRTLLLRAPYGCAFTLPPTILLAGAPNAGKSTLANALLGSERCIVTPEPGTTRDLIAADVALAGHPFRLLDSAGVRDSQSPVEAAGVRRTLEAAERADLVLLVLDGTAPPPHFPEWLNGRTKALALLNKSDLGLNAPALAYCQSLGVPVVSISAKEGTNLGVLIEAVLFRSPFRGPATRDLACPFTGRQVELLERALERIGTEPSAAIRALDRLLDVDGEALP